MSQAGKYISGTTPLPDTPAFFARRNTPVTNVTGDGTAYTVVFTNVIYNITSSYNNATGVFTAPVDGKYLITFSLMITGLTASHTSGATDIATSSAGLSTYAGFAGNFGALRDATNVVRTNGSAHCFLSAGDTVSIVLTVSGGTKVVDLFGSSASALTFFQGILLNTP